MYKFSIFNSRISLSEKTDLLYNALSDRFMLIKKDIQTNDFTNITESSDLHKELVQGGFAVDINKDEIEAVKSLSNKIINDESLFYLIINPTLSCNFKCWYCYETNKPKEFMDESLIHKVKLFIHTQAEKRKSLQISFFGGEPLLGHEHIVKPLMEYAKAVTTQTGCKLSVGFTTNGFLINDSLISFWTENNVTCVQITLDGNKELHNNTRFPFIGCDTYSVIIQNVKKLLDAKIKVILRFNCTNQNIESFGETIDDLSALPNKSHLTIQLHQVWQNANIDITEKVDDLIDLFVESGFNASRSLFDNVRKPCYGDLKNSAIINYNGDVFKCTAVDFATAKRNGFLNDSGEIVWENDDLQKCLLCKFTNKPCLKCRLLPICNGACSQKYIQNEGDEFCINNFDERKKDHVVLDKFKFYISNL